MPRHSLLRCLTVLGLTLAGCGTGAEREPLLLLITVDTLRADLLGAYGGDRALTPNLDALANESQLFEFAYAPAPFTRPSIAALLTGREPARIGMTSNRSLLPEDVPTLAELFAQAGWATGAVVSNAVLQRRTGLARGFAVYDDDAGDAQSGRGAAATTDAAVATLDGMLAVESAGLFLWVHYQDPHGPYTPPPGYRERFLAAERRRHDGNRRLAVSGGQTGAGGIPDYQVIGDERTPAFYRAGYAGETLHVDEQIGRLLAALRERALFGDAVIVFAADHGEGLGENDYWFAHGENLSEALVRVPLLIRTPAHGRAKRRDVASLIDVAGTLAGEFGLALAAGDDGRSLLAPDAAESSSDVFLSTLAYVKPPMFGVASQHFRYVIDKPDEATRERFYRTGEDVETDAEASRAEFERLRDLTIARVREMKSLRAELQAPLADDERRQLRALGYTDD